MTDLRFQEPATTEEFCRWLSAMQAPLPWREGADPGDLLDANGEQVAIVALSRDPLTAAEVGRAILVAVNTCGGFRVASTGQ